MAELADMFLVMAVLLGLTVAIFTSDLILVEIREANNETQAINQTILDAGQDTIRTFNLSFAVALLGAGLALFLGAFLMDQHPAFLPLNLIVFIILIFVAAQLGNTAIQYAQSPSMISTANEYGVIIFMWQNIPTILLLLGALTIIVGFAKVSRRGGSSI